MNHYFSMEPAAARSTWPPALVEGIEAARKGELDENALASVGCFQPGINGYQRDAFLWRDVFIHHVGFAVPSRQWLDSMATLLAGKRVLEVCAGHGTLVAPMRARGVEWCATDSRPHGPLVEKGEARATVKAAIAAGSVDVLFASWVPLDSPLDAWLCRQGPPVVLVTEGYGGCTGSPNLWQQHDPQAASHVVPGFRDVPRWQIIHDFTALVNWSS